MLKDSTEPISRMKDFWLSTHTFDVLNTVSPNKMICLVEIIREPLSVVDIKQVDSIFAVDLFGNNIIDHRRHQHVIISVTCWAIALRHVFVLTTFRCCLGSNTEQMHGNMKSIC